MQVKPNKYLEEWASHRENVEQSFKFNLTSLSLFAVFGIAAPCVLYRSVCNEYRAKARALGQPEQEFAFMRPPARSSRQY